MGSKARDSAPHFTRAEQGRIAAALTPSNVARALAVFHNDEAWATCHEEDEVIYMMEDFAAGVVASLCPDLEVGKCATCGCVDVAACPGGCAWADLAHTLCTSCA